MLNDKSFLRPKKKNKPSKYKNLRPAEYLVKENEEDFAREKKYVPMTKIIGTYYKL